MASIKGPATQTTAAVQVSSDIHQAEFVPSIPASFDPPMLGERGLRHSDDNGSYIVYGDRENATGLKREGTGQSNDSGKRKVPFKDQVIGIAQKTRGTVMNKPELKAHGETILQGETTHAQDRY